MCRAPSLESEVLSASGLDWFDAAIANLNLLMGNILNPWSQSLVERDNG